MVDKQPTPVAEFDLHITILADCHDPSLHPGVASSYQATTHFVREPNFDHPPFSQGLWQSRAGSGGGVVQDLIDVGHGSSSVVGQLGLAWFDAKVPDPFTFGQINIYLFCISLKSLGFCILCKKV